MNSERKVYRVCSMALVDVEQAQSIERNVQEKPLTRRLFRSTPAELFYVKHRECIRSVKTFL